MKYSINNTIKNKVFIIGLGLLSFLLIILIYLSYIQVVKGPSLYEHQLNRRAAELTKQIERGRILDTKGKVLAYSEKNAALSYQRIYPYGKITAHLVGYDSEQFGNAGIEGTFNGFLTGISNPQHRLGAIEHLWKPSKGNDIELTINYAIQEAAYNALGNRRGAIVALNPKTGAVLALVSKPSFDPNELEKNWKSISTSPLSPMLNRAVQGLYPPGSTLKIMIAEAALREKITNTEEQFLCNGSLQIGKDYVLSESHNIAHGKVNLEDALAESCNITFGQLSLKLGRSRLSNTFARYGFNQPTGIESGEGENRLPDFDKLTDGDLAQTGIGQGSLLVTPLRMVMLTSVFANQGVMMKPYLVNRIISPDGSIINQAVPEKWLAPADSNLSNVIKKMMVSVVENGTGTAAHLSGISVAGKTGTAENPHGDSHAWFVGFAPADNPVIAIAVIVENSGSGGSVAAPIARQVLAQALY